MTSENRERQYLVLNVGEIAEGLDGISPGWAMGSFCSDASLRHSVNFEIKEWDANQVQSAWENHTDRGNEYIAVLDGVLTVSIGRQSEDGGMQVERVVNVSKGQRIILGPGVWRKYQSSAEAAGITIRGTGIQGEKDYRDRYTAITDHWKHTDQVRHSLLNNWLLASSVLVVAWTTLYTSERSIAAIIPMIFLSVIGIFASALWFLVVRRATGYYDMYEAEALRVERTMPTPMYWPFHRRAKFQANQREGRQEIKFFNLARFLPLVFLYFFALTTILSIIRGGT